MTAPTHLKVAGLALWEDVTSRQFDPRDAHLLATLCDIADLEAAAREAVQRNIADDKAHAAYARLVDKKHKLLDAMGMTPRSRVKLGEVPVDDVAEDIRNFAMN